jgi:DNA-binding IclR family transcriptional regulator
MRAGRDRATVLEWLRRHGTGRVSATEAAALTGLPRGRVITVMHYLEAEGLICRVQEEWGTSAYVVRHLHAAPGPCGIPLAVTLDETT